MTRKQKEAMIRKLAREMLANTYREMKVKIDLAIKSGAIDYDEYGTINSYIIPKCILAAVLDSAQQQYLAQGTGWEKYVKHCSRNIRYFL